MAEKLRIGILGAARVATYAMIAPAKTSARAEVVAVAARDFGRARDYAKTHGIARAHVTYDALVRDPDIDLVYIATTPSTHATLAHLAIGAGKHVLMEKPATMGAAEAEGVRLAADLAGVRVFEAMHSRHHRLHTRIADIVASGAIGAVRNTDARFCIARPPAGDFRYDAALGGGALMDLGIYPLAWTRALLGESFAVESAHMRREDGADLETSATLRFSNGVRSKTLCRLDAEVREARFIIEGDAGRIDVTNPLAPQLGHLIRTETASGARDETVEGVGTFDTQLAAVCATLLDGAPFPLPADDFVQSMRAIDAVRGAANT
jgi:predicted dehydrogenase